MLLGDSLFIDSIVALNSWRLEGIEVWQQLMPLQLVPSLFVSSVVFFTQTDMQPPTIVPSGDVNDAKLSHSKKFVCELREHKRA